LKLDTLWASVDLCSSVLPKVCSQIQHLQDVSIRLWKVLIGRAFMIELIASEDSPARIWIQIPPMHRGSFMRLAHVDGNARRSSLA
jgi:hypothetical protein